MSDLPAPTNPVDTAIAKSIEEAAATARHYLDKLLSPGLEAGGGLVSDTVNFWRFKNKIRLILKAKEYLEAKGIEPRRVLPKALLPILEAGSLEEDVDLQDTWAQLLANAADSSRADAILPAYPHILAELTPFEVRLLGLVYDNHRNEIDSGELPHVSTDHIAEAIGLRLGPANLYPHAVSAPLAIHNLARLRIIEQAITVDADELTEFIVDNTEVQDGIRGVQLKRQYRHPPFDRQEAPEIRVDQSQYVLTPFGVDFIRACRRD